METIKRDDPDEDDVMTSAKVKLRIYDSVHDFWKKRDSKSISEDEEGVSIDLLEFIRDDLNAKIYDVRGKIGNQTTSERGSPRTSPISTQLQTLSNDNNVITVGSATSSFEITVQDYFESHPLYKQYLYEETRLRISYQDIIEPFMTSPPFIFTEDKENGIPDTWKPYIRNNATQRILEIYDKPSNDNTGFKDMLYDDDKKNYINTFILCYMYGAWEPSFMNKDDSAPKAFLTFDAAGKYVKKLFKDDNRVHNLITPQNIADSATTSFNQLNDRIKFYFPVNETKTNTFTVTSDIFNRENSRLPNPIDIAFVNDGFNEQNRYGFNINLAVTQQNQGSNAPKKYSSNVVFTEQAKEGPSVNYLASFMQTLNASSDTAFQTLSVAKKNTLVDIVTPLQTIYNSIPDAKLKKTMLSHIQDSGILYDLKRMGDHEQCEAAHQFGRTDTSAPTILVTLDRLCSVYARFLEQPCIFHNNDTLVLYRVPIMLDETAIENAKYYYKIIDIIHFYSSTTWIQSLESQLLPIQKTLSGSLQELMANKDRTMYGDVVYIYPLSEYILKRTDDSSKYIIQELLTIKLLSILMLIETTLQVIRKITLPLENQATITEATQLKQLYESGGTFTDISKQQINTTHTQINTLKQNEWVEIEKFKQAFNISFLNDGTMAPILEDDEIIVMKNTNGEYVVPKNGSNAYLGLYYNSYRVAFESLHKVFRLIKNDTSIKRLVRNKTTLFNAIVKTEYFDNLKKITELNGLDEGLLSDLNDIVFIQNSNNNDVVMKQIHKILPALKDIKIALLVRYATQMSEGMATTTDTSTAITTATTTRSRQPTRIRPTRDRPTRRGAYGEDANDKLRQPASRYGPVTEVDPGPVSVSVPAENTIDPPRRSPRLQQGGTTSEQSERLYIDFGEILFEISSRCSEFYYSILSNEANNDIENMLALVTTEDTYKTSINELFEECSLRIQNRFFTIMNHDVENGDAYTYNNESPSLPIYYVLYLFLYDASTDSETIEPDTQEDDDGDVSITSEATVTGEARLINEGVTIYNDNIEGVLQQASTIRRNIDPNFNNLKEAIETTELRQMPIVVKTFITFTFALLYDLSFKGLRDKSRFLPVIFNGFDDSKINAIVNDYTDKMSVDTLMSRLYVLFKTVFIRYNNLSQTVPDEIKNLLIGGSSTPIHTISEKHKINHVHKKKTIKRRKRKHNKKTKKMIKKTNNKRINNKKPNKKTIKRRNKLTKSMNKKRTTRKRIVKKYGK